MSGSSDHEGISESDDSGDEDFTGLEDEGFLSLMASKAAREKVITKESVVAAQKTPVEKVAEMLNIKLEHGRTLLRHYRWDKERLFANFVEKGAEKLFAEAGVPYQGAFSELTHSEQGGKHTCCVCFEDKEDQECTQMECGHTFCNDCWTQYFVISIQRGQSKRLKCMADKCEAICDEDKVLALISAKDPRLQQHYQRFLLESYIEDNDNVKWCPSIPSCGNAIRIEGEPYCEVECICGHQFCYNCLQEAHSPCSCQMWKLWTQKNQDESETANWITAHAKFCPKCRKPVEKNGGCNLVACICGQAFCWLCGEATGRSHDWNSIDGHSCGGYKQKDDVAKAEHDLKRYIHCYSRYRIFEDSCKGENIQRQTLQQKISMLENTQHKVRDYSWLTNGLNLLFRGRRVLQYSYVFAYYMFGSEMSKDNICSKQNGLNSGLFEEQQNMLEVYLQRLLNHIETSYEILCDDEKVSEIRLSAIGLAEVTNSSCRKMYDVIENELLSSLLTATHIAPYSPTGPEKVSVIKCLSNSIDEALGTKGEEEITSLIQEQSTLVNLTETINSTGNMLREAMQNYCEFTHQKGKSLKRPFEG